MAVTVEKVGNRIWARAPYSPGIEARFKKIIGASFSKGGGHGPRWTYPLDIIICRDLRKEFKEALQIGPELTQWAMDVVKRESELLPLLTALDVDDLPRVRRLAPIIWEAMNDDACMEPGCRLKIESTPERGPYHPSPKGMEHHIKSHRYQKAVVKYGAAARRFQNASQPGLGKTIESLATIIESGITGPVLVAAPKTSLRTVWEPEIKRWLPGIPVFTATGGKPRRTHIITEGLKAWHSGNHSLVFIVINPEVLRTHRIDECPAHGCDHKDKDAWNEHKAQKHKTITYYEHEYPELFDQHWAGFGVDETHRYLLRTNLRSGKATLAGNGAMLLPMADDYLKFALSGTPWKGKPRNAWHVGHWLYGDIGLTASFWNWAFRMLNVYEGEYGMVIDDQSMETGITDHETFNAWTNSFMIRHTKAEMAPWLPPKSYGGSYLDPTDHSSPIAVWLEMEGKQATAYKSMLDNAMASLDNGTLTATGVLAERTRLKQFASNYGDLQDKLVKGELVKEFHPRMPSNKFDWTVEFLEEMGITGDNDEDGEGKVIIASQFTKTINAWADAFEAKGIKCFRLTGEQSDAKRMEYVKRFQESGGPRVFLINTMAGGVSVTLDAADDLIFIDETDVPDDQEQVEDRTHRTSKVHNVTIWYLKSLGTVDEIIARQNYSKDMAQKRLLDGKRGIDFARRLLAG